MSNKFTEEQYKKIVGISDAYKINSCFGIIGDTTQKSIGAEFYETELAEEIDFYENAEEMMAIVNPLTREWAHDKFVEKEKKYYWTTKKSDNYGLTGRLYKTTDDSIKPDFDDVHNYDNDERLTESEIIEWGYNPEMFDKEEVKMIQ